MKTFLVTIKETLTKSIEVDAQNEEDAVERAHELFIKDKDRSKSVYEIIDTEDVSEYRRKVA